MDSHEADEALLLAAGAGDVRSVRDHLARGASPNARLRRHRSLKRADGTPIPHDHAALHEAARAGHLDALRALLDAPNADVNVRFSPYGSLQSDFGPSPLEAAAAANRAAAVSLLIDRGAAHLDKALQAAARSQIGAGEAVQALLERGVHPRPDCLQSAAGAGNAGAVRAVLAALPEGPERTAAVAACSYDAARGGSGEVVRRAPPRPGPRPGAALAGLNKCTPVAFAALRGKLESVTALVELGARIAGVTMAGLKGQPAPVSDAISWPPRGATPRYLLSRGAALEARDAEGMTPLLKAAACGHGPAVEALAAAGADLAARETGPFGRPCRRARRAGLGEMAPRSRTPARQRVLRTPLGFAVKRGDAEAVRLLLASGSSPHSATTVVRVTGSRESPSEGDPPLHVAAAEGFPEIVRLLAEAGADIGAGAKGFPPLEKAIASGRREVVRLLLEMGCPAGEAAEARQKKLAGALPHAVDRGDPGLVRELLARGASPRCWRWPQGWGPCEIAARRGYLEILQLLVQHEPPTAEVLDKVAAGAAQEGSAACLRLALERGADPRRRFQERGEQAQEHDPWVTPLLLAAQHGRPDCVRELLDRGADPAEVAGVTASKSKKKKKGEGDEGQRAAAPPPDEPPFTLSGPSALELAAGNGHAAVAWRPRAATRRPWGPARVRANPANPEAIKDDDMRGPALHAAAHRADVATVRALLAGGAPVNQADASSRTPIMRPLDSYDTPLQSVLETLRELMRAGADPFYGWEATPTKEWFLERGVDTSLAYLSPEQRTAGRLGFRRRNEPKTPRTFLHALLHVENRHWGARPSEELACLRLILDGGADVNEFCGGSAPLHLAAARSSPDIIRILVERGAALEARDAAREDSNRPYPGGRTPLLVAVHACKEGASLEAVEALLDAGADVGARDAAGRSGAAQAAAATNLELLRLLMARGAGRHAEEGEILAAACERSSSDSRGILGFCSRRSCGGRARRGTRGPPYAEALEQAMEDGSATAADDARQWADLLLCCPGPLRLSEVRALRSQWRGDPDDPRAALVAAAARLLRLEGRVEAEPPLDLREAQRGTATAPPPQEHREQEERGGGRPAAAAAAAAADAADGETPLHAACRAGLRLTALRLARAATPDAVEAADAANETALSRAVAFGPALLDVCALLLQKGADLGRKIGGAQGGQQRAVLDCTMDTAFRAQLKRAAAARDAFISYGHHPPEVAAFTARLRDRLQAGGVSCWMDEMKATGIEAGTEWREQIGAGIRAARAVLFVASKAGAAPARPRPPPPLSPRPLTWRRPQHSCASDWCMLELSRARDLGRPIFPVWAEAPFPLDDRSAGLLRGCRFVDLSSPPLLEAGFSAFLAAALLGRPDARCDPRAGPFLFVWALPEDAPHAASLLSALAFRGVPCWLDIPGAGPASEAAGAEATLSACAACVPLLSAASVS
eukprot:tig00000581_g2243.t1